MLLAAFLLNLLGLLGAASRGYQSLNAAGAGLACYSAFLIGFVPFVVLEGAWAVVAILALMRLLGRPSIRA
jgi:hypothetical protein